MIMLGIDPGLSVSGFGKQRNGPTGTVDLHFQNNLILFQDPES